MAERNEAEKSRLETTEEQPDPFLREGRSPTAWVWIVAAIIVAAIAVTFVVTTRSPQTAQNQAPHNTPLPTGPNSKAAQPALPAGRTGDAAAPSATTTGSH
ncbi:MAG: hypothetical protein P8Y53_06155 [Pseudolabrys sp.]|jgi:hypothetical protein